ncbi:MAG: DUF3046 domain-containing protein [Bifidobacteriaceae bacterium]|nr:DUF3046 domain-containing protein [Bifidobacteriaceae bacterium]
MRHSEFWESMEQAFGPVYAKSLASDLVLSTLGSRSAVEALDAGLPPRQVWEALCDAMELPEALRWRHRDPKPRARH